MTTVTDCESSYSHSCTAPSTSSSINHIFLSPGQTLPVTPSVSPLSPLHIENALVTPMPVSLIPSPSPVPCKVGPISPQHQPTATLQQSVQSEASHSQSAFISALTIHPIHTHTALSQSTHPPTNGSTQPLIQVIMMAVLECRCLPRRCELEPLIVIISVIVFTYLFASQNSFGFRVTVLMFCGWRIMNVYMFSQIN